MGRKTTNIIQDLDEFHRLHEEVLTLRVREQERVQVQEELESTLQNLTIHQEELRAQNEKLRLVQHQLEDSHTKYLDLFESAPIGYLILEGPGIIRQVNLTGSEMLGYARAHLTGKPFFLYVASAWREKFSAHLRAAFANSRVSTIEVDLFHSSGKPFTAILESIPIPDETKEIKQCRMAIVDITERKHLEEQLHAARQYESLGILAGGVAHDFNNLLMAIVAHANLALPESAVGSSLHGHLQKIEKAGLRGGELANQMMVYSGGRQPVVQAFDLSNVVDEMGHLLQVSISKGTELSFDLVPNLPPIEADPSQVRQIVMNLLTNASEAVVNRCGTITISTGIMGTNFSSDDPSLIIGEVPRGNCVFFEVRDTGVGIDPETLQKIFDPFFSTKFPGRGLGLAALAGIVRAHGAAIVVWSAQGEGSCFRVVFPPALSRVVSLVERPTTPDGWQGTGTVLVVDDENDVLEATAALLQKSGYHVLSASNGLEGVNLLRDHHEEVVGVLLDLTMPHMNGEEAFLEI
ncbi:MAG: ATP-binding protein, partial [Nitrospirota bacterium]|nr:ATP-binding protein [Nitrospirota bacterium]